jgi:PAS domain S-box-containing protein
MSTLLQVLMIEDVEADALLSAAELGRAGYTVDFTRVDSEAALRAALEKRTWDLILCDFSLPGFSGAEALRIAKEVAGDVPFIFVSGTIGEAAVVEAMRSGAQDYVMKDRLKRLAPAVTRELREAAVRREARQADRWMRESEHKYRQLFDALNEAVFVIEEATGRIIDTNLQAEHLLLRERAGIVGENLASLFFLRNDASVLAELAAAATDRSQGGFMLSLLRSDGTSLPVHASASRIELYGRSFLLALMHVRVGRRAGAVQVPMVGSLGDRGAEELARSKRLMEAVGRLARVGGWELDPASGELVWSETVRRIHEAETDFRPTLENATGFYAPESAPVFAAAVKRAIEEGVPFDEELSLVGARGGLHRVRVIGEAVREAGKTTRIIGVLQEIAGR